LNETVRLGSATYYQPATSDFRDMLAWEQASLQVKLTDRLDLTLSLEITPATARRNLSIKPM